MEEVEPVAPFAMKQMMNKFIFKITRPIKRSTDGDNYLMSHEAAEVESSPRITKIVVESEVVTSAPPPSPPLSVAPSSLHGEMF